MLQLKNVTHRYGTHTALDDVNLLAKPGEIVGLLGVNGAGKSTLLNIAATQILPTSGQVFINNISNSHHWTYGKAHIGYLPDTPPLYENLTIEENLQLLGQLRQIPKLLRTKRIKELQALCVLESKKHQLASSLSKGFRQRLGLAMCLLHQPAVIILDEPGDGLDPKQLPLFHALIQSASQEAAILLSSHNIHEVERICTRVEIIHKGKLIEGFDGSNKKSSYIAIFAQPLNKTPSVDGWLSEAINAHAYRFHHEALSEPQAQDVHQLASTLCQLAEKLIEFKKTNTSLTDRFMQVIN